jgi:gluconate kinase
MTGKAKICLVSCSVLKEEIAQLIKQGSLDADVVFVSKYFHVDYEVLEKNLRKVLEQL